jgi:hypothetical protein
MKSPLDALLDEVSGVTAPQTNELEQTLTKQASDGDDTMSQKGLALADNIIGMLKRANNVIDETDDMVADADDAIEDTPLVGTITDTAKAIMDRAGVDEDEDMDEDTEDTIEKAAALGELLESGYSFDDAVEMVKQAAMGKRTPAMGKRTPTPGKAFNQAPKAAPKAAPMGKMDKVKAFAKKNKKALGIAAGVAAATGVGAALASREKRAFIESLTAEGYDLEDAVALVKQASELAENEMIKAASILEAVQSGYSFDDAVAYMTTPQYSDLEKAAAVKTLVEEDGLDVERALQLVNEAARG